MPGKFSSALATTSQITLNSLMTGQRLAEDREPAFVADDRRPGRDFRPDAVQRFFQAIPAPQVPGSGRLKDIAGRVDDKAALRLGFARRCRRYRCRQISGLLYRALEYVVRQPVPLLAKVLVTSAAVLVETPDVRGKVTDGPGQSGQVFPVDAAYHGGQLQPDVRLLGHQPGRLDHLVEICHLSPHRAVNLGRRA